jgi:TP901 family phage tail tape measure protein
MRPFTVKSEIVAVDKASKNINKINQAAERMTKSVTKESNISGNAFSRFANSIGMGVKKISVSLGNLNTRLSVFSNNVKKKVDNVLGTFGKLGIGIGLGLILSGAVQANVELDKNMQSLSAVTGVAGEQFEGYKKEVFDASKAMNMFSGDMAKAFEVIGSQKPELLASAEAMKMVTVSAVTLSRASGEDLASSANNLTGIMNQFNLGALQSSEAIDILAAGTIAGASSIAETGEAMKNFGTVAYMANMNLEQATATIQLLSLYQLKGAEAGTKARGAINQLQKAGIGYKSGLFKINDALIEAKNRYDNLGSAVKKDAFIEKTFGAENKTAGLILMNNVGRIEEITKAVSERGKAEEMANKNTNTFSNLWEQITASFRNTVTSIQSNTVEMDKLKNAMRWVAANAEKIVSVAIKVVSIFLIYKAVTISLRIAQEGLRAVTFIYNIALGIQAALLGSASIAMKGNTIAIAAMNIATKSMAIGTWLLSGGLVTATTATWAFAAALWATGIPEIVIAIAALGVGIFMLIKHFDKVKAFALKAWDAIEKNPILKFLILPIYLAIKSIIMLVNGIKYLIANFDKVKAKAIELFNTITGNPIVKLLLFPIWATISAIRFLIQNFGTIKQVFVNVFTSIWNTLKSFWGFISAIGKFIAAVFEMAWNSVVDKVLWVWNVIKGFFSGMLSGVSGFASKISAFFQPIVDFISNIGSKLLDGIINKFKSIGEFVSKIIDKIGAFFGGAAEKINAKTEQIITINDQRNKLASDAIKSTEINKNIESQIITETNKTIENEAIKTQNTDKLISALDKNTESTDEETKIQKDKKDEWKGKFKTFIVKDQNVNDKTNITNEYAQKTAKKEQNNLAIQKEVFTETNISKTTTDLAKTSIKNEENVVNSQKEILKNTETNKINDINNETNKVNNITKQTENSIVDKSNISNKIAEKSIRNEENVSNVQREILKENNVSNIENVDVVRQKQISTSTDIPTFAKNKKQKRDEITINVIDKTGTKFGIQVESTGIDLIRTGNG